MMPGARALRTHPDPAQIVMPPLRRHLGTPRLLGNPAGHIGPGPQPAMRCWALHRRGQFLLLLDGEQRTARGRPLLQAPIPHGRWAVSVIATNHPAGIVHIQADQCSGILDRLAVGNKGEQLPAPGFHQVRCLAGALAQLTRWEMGMEGEFACHAAA